MYNVMNVYGEIINANIKRKSRIIRGIPHIGYKEKYYQVHTVYKGELQKTPFIIFKN